MMFSFQNAQTNLHNHPEFAGLVVVFILLTWSCYIAWVLEEWKRYKNKIL